MISKRISLFLVSMLVMSSILAFGPVDTASAAGLPLCNSVRESRIGKIVPTNGSNPDCLIGDGLAACGGTNCAPIMQLQQSLKSCNGQNIKVDGWWGPQTKQAVKNVQSGKTTVDGIYGPKTRNIMKHLPSCKVY